MTPSLCSTCQVNRTSLVIDDDTKATTSVNLPLNSILNTTVPEQSNFWLLTALTLLRRRVLTTKSWRDTTSSDTNFWVHLVSGHKWCPSIGWCDFDASHHAGATAMCLLNLDQICPCIFRSLWFSAHLPEMAHSVAVVICLIIQRCRWFFKSGWASSNAVGVIGLTELPNSRWAKAHPATH